MASRKTIGGYTGPTMTAAEAGFGLAHQEMYRVASIPSERGITNILKAELAQLDGVSEHNPDTGIAAKFPGQFLNQYTTKLFGAPFQLLPSVDSRFDDINPLVGTEYLRNFLLNSPILTIRPGMPIYTGGNNLVKDTIKDMFLSEDVGQSIMLGLAKSTIFKKGQLLQRRLFGFRETYLNYMSNVNYMCRSVASYMGISEMGTFVPTSAGNCNNLSMVPFSKLRWENYRMLNTYVRTTSEQIGAMAGATTVARGANSFGNFIYGVWSSVSGMNQEMANLDANLDEVDPITGKSVNDDLAERYALKMEEASSAVNESWDDVNASNNSIDVMDQKVKSVSFMVEPVTFSETLSNTTASSMISSAVDNLDEGIGSEIAFITNAHADVGVIGDATKFMANAMTDLAGNLAKLIEPATGGFATNLFSGAMGALKGQKMIYPEIYKTSSSSMNHDFSVTLSSPYGDKYNYFMEVVVPLLHLIALAAPRMISANTTTSPYMVQAYIPGMVTCQLGIISDMTIKKNPTGKHVSVHGYPLTIKVDFTIKELYNSMAVSPANDPASFMFNETLNDYLVNISGLIPSRTAYKAKREQAWGSLKQYFSGELWNDMTSGVLETWENIFTNYS